MEEIIAISNAENVVAKAPPIIPTLGTRIIQSNMLRTALDIFNIC